jgi:hypothetical protein
MCFTDSAGRAQRGGYNHLTQWSDFNGRIRTFDAVPFFTLLANDRKIDSYLLDLNDFYSGTVTGDFSRVKKGTIYFTTTASGAPG